MELKCMTCKMPLMNTRGAARFKCPSCLDYEIIRCVHCRKTATTYSCPKCGFEGPN